MAERDPSLAPKRAYPAYREDYAAWLDTQMNLLRQQRFEELDLDNLLDEVNDLGLSNFKAFVSAIEIVIANMLKWDHQPEKRSRSWIASIIEHRLRIEQDLADSPSYKSRIPDAMRRAYRTAVPTAARETGLDLRPFPADNPYSWDEVMGRDHRLD